MKTGAIITAEHAGRDFFSSFEDKFVIMDNIDCKTEPIIRAKEEIYNSHYTYVTVVLRGTLHMTINNTDVDVKADEYIVVMPCMNVKIKESKCIYFAMLTQAQIVHDIYEHSNIGRRIRLRCFCFHHHVFAHEDIETLINDYTLLKREHLRKPYPMKGMALRAHITAYLAHLYSFIDKGTEKTYITDNRQQVFFNKFLEFLSEFCKSERSVQFYADKLKITPKYLSSITTAYTGLSASVVIDQYVIFAIKRMLYANEYNIKTVSELFHFPSQSFFGRYFKRITGMSPNAYQKSYNRKLINGNQT